MKPIIKIAKTELQKLFYSPVAWIILVIFTFQVSALFVENIGHYLHFQHMRAGFTSLTWRVFANANFPTGIYQSLTQYLYLYIPLLTMNIMSRELSTGSIKLLYSSPVTSRQIIIGKYLALVIFSLVLLAIVTAFSLYALTFIDQADTAFIWSGLLGLFLMLCAYCALGLFMSSLTSYAIVAAIGTLGVLALLGYIKSVGQDIAFVRDITYWLAISGRVQTFINGLLTSEDVLYFLIVICLFLSFTIVRLQSGRQKSSAWITSAKYAGVFIVAMLTGYISTMRGMKGYKDLTRTQENTLTRSSQEVVKKLPPNLTITTYSNMLDKFNTLAIPAAYKRDAGRFEQYLRFKPDIELKYKYYWHPTPNPQLDKQFPNLNDQQRLDTLKIVNQWGFEIEPYHKDIAGGADLSSEGFRFVRVLETSEGKRTFLRVFDDIMISPSEAEITAAMKRLVEDLPVVGFVTGHGERESSGEHDRGYKRFAQEKTFRHSLINNGFDFKDISLDSPVTPDINILVIAEMKQKLNETQNHNLQEYVNRGGNLLIAGEPGRQEFMNPITETLGIRFLPGQLAKNSEKYQSNLAVCSPAAESIGFSYHFQSMQREQMELPLLSTTGLEFTGKGEFDIIELFRSDSTAWNELQTTDFIDSKPSLDPQTETHKAYPVVAALTRKVHDREQRIMVTGDADWLSNGELSMNRKELRPANFKLIQATFFWLSDGEVPIDMRRDPPIDNTLNLSQAQWNFSSLMLKWVFPAVLLVISLLILVRRKRR